MKWFMDTKKFFGKLASGYMWGNLLAMAVVVVLLCIGVKYGLEFYTHHGEGIIVPKVQGMTYNKARLLLEQEGLVILVTDWVTTRRCPPTASSPRHQAREQR